MSRITDAEFTRAFEQGAVTPDQFDHHAHLRVAWVYLHETATAGEALARIREGIQRFAAAAAVPQKYHETITVLWMRLLDQARAAGASGELAEVLRRHPALGDKDLPLQYYTRDRLFSDAARAIWVEPDVRPLTPVA